MHIETLYLDHNFDWPIINTSFDSIADMAYAGVRAYLESKGMYCGDDPNNPPPYPAPPSAEMLKRWRDLGYQNYQRYGADPVSFSTGNHIVQVRLTRIPGRGGTDFDSLLMPPVRLGHRDPELGGPQACDVVDAVFFLDRYATGNISPGAMPCLCLARQAKAGSIIGEA